MSMALLGAGINTLAFVETNYAFSKSGRGDAETERKRYDLAKEKLLKWRDEWNKDRMKRLDFINKWLRQKNEEAEGAELSAGGEVEI